LYNHLDVVKVAEVVSEHVARGVVVRKFIEAPPAAVVPTSGEPSRGEP
jgi:hypothetical protein